MAEIYVDIMRSRITSGSNSLDRMMEGGIPTGNIVVVAGGPGAGKTLLSFEFAYKNAKEGKTVLVISLEEGEAGIIQNAKDAFSDFTDIDQLIESKHIVIYDAAKIMKRMRPENTYFTREEFVGEFFNNMAGHVGPIVLENGADIVSLDGFSIMKSYLRDIYSYRDLTARLSDTLKEARVTAIITSEIVATDEGKPKFEPEFFAFDGIIVLYSLLVGGKLVPSIEIIKMRGSDHSYDILPYKITHSGIEIIGRGDA